MIRLLHHVAHVAVLGTMTVLVLARVAQAGLAQVMIVRLALAGIALAQAIVQVHQAGIDYVCASRIFNGRWCSSHCRQFNLHWLQDGQERQQRWLSKSSGNEVAGTGCFILDLFT